MSTKISRRLGALTVAVAAGAAIAPSAIAAQGDSVPVAGGSTNLHLNAATAGVLSDAGLSVAPVGPAKAAGLRVSFPITGGRIDPSTAVGRVSHSGGLAFSSHGTTVRLTNFLVRTTGSPVLTAAVGKARIPLASIDLSKAAVIRRGSGGIGTWVVRAQANLTPAAAGALNAAFGTHLPGGVNIGRVDLKAQPSQVILRGRRHDAGARRRHRRGADLAWRGALGDRAGDRLRRGPALPVTSGRLSATTFAGSILHSGGIALTAGATRVELKNFRINVTGSPNLTAQVGDSATRVPLTVDLSKARTGISRRTAVVRDARVSLTAGAAAALNAAFGTTALAAGLPLGIADVRAQVR